MCSHGLDGGRYGLARIHLRSPHGLRTKSTGKYGHVGESRVQNSVIIELLSAPLE